MPIKIHSSWLAQHVETTLWFGVCRPCRWIGPERLNRGSANEDVREHVGALVFRQSGVPRRKRGRNR